MKSSLYRQSLVLPLLRYREPTLQKYQNDRNVYNNSYLLFAICCKASGLTYWLLNRDAMIKGLKAAHIA